ncbi:MAG: hypothetical protein GY777_28355, partial [Candidatus Brocadiaceae bacterium]|nr:hypothetical protein [Candidatus Brocadiaceae bacterium]
HPQVISTCLHILGDDAKSEARELIWNKEQNPHVLSMCLQILGDDAKAEAKELLKNSRQHPELLSACLQVLGEDEKSKATELLKIKGQHPLVLSTCFDILAEDFDKRHIPLEGSDAEWLIWCVSEINNVSWIFRILLFVKLSFIEGKDEYLNCLSQCFFTSRERAGTPS